MNFRALVKKLAHLVPVPATTVDYLLHRAYHMSFAYDGSAAEDKHPVQALLDQVRRNGFAVIENYLSPELCEQCIKDMEWMFREKPEHVQKYSDLRIYGAEVLSRSMDVFYADPMLLAAANHFNARPTVNAFTLANKVEAKKGSLGSGEGWHKDSSFRQFKAFVYLNDITEENGPLQIISGSHLLQEYIRDMRAGGLRFRHLRITDQQVARIIERRPDRLITVSGRQGTLIVANTAVIHRGCPPVSGVRYALTNYYLEKNQISETTADIWKPVSRAKLIGLGPAHHGD